MPTEPATETMVVSSVASTETSGVTPPCALTVDAAPTEAVVVSESTRIVGATAIPAELPIPPAAVSAMMSSFDFASTVTPPLPLTTLCAPTRAVTVSVCTSVELAMPTPALPALAPTAPAIISAFRSP